MSFLMTAHQESSTASAVLNAQTKRKGLSGPSQLTSEKLKILISTPTIASGGRYRTTAAFPLRHPPAPQPPRTARRFLQAIAPFRPALVVTDVNDEMGVDIAPVGFEIRIHPGKGTRQPNIELWRRASTYPGR